jgi:hypothetical protein
MTDPDQKKSDPTTAEALADWRQAEQAAAVARRGRLAAQVAAQAAEDAVEAANATAAAAKSALDAAILAETSASKTATAARLVVQSTRDHTADAESDLAIAEIEEAEAHDRYRQALDRADKRRGSEPAT